MPEVPPEESIPTPQTVPPGEPTAPPNGTTTSSPVTDPYRTDPFPTTPGTGKQVGSEAPPPTAFGRYRVLARIGQGGFGVVYKGYDAELRREVAIKVPHPARVACPEDVEAYLHEARVLA